MLIMSLVKECSMELLMRYYMQGKNNVIYRCYIQIKQQQMKRKRLSLIIKYYQIYYSL
jgi:hypothetical protein